MNNNQGEVDLQGTLLSRSWYSTASFPQASLHPNLDHNPISPGHGPTLLHPAFQNNGRRRLGYNKI